MNKKDFAKYINKQLEGMSLERQIKELQKVQQVYLPNLICARRKKKGEWVEPDKKENYTLCNKCKKYSLKSRCKEETVKEVRTVVTYRDAGYGDDDMEGNVEYLVTYSICPVCGYKQEKKKRYIGTINEWNVK